MKTSELTDDEVKCPHCGEVSHIGGLIGPNTNDCPKCGKPVIIPKETLA